MKASVTQPDNSTRPPAAYVFIERARCPECGSCNLRTYHSAPQGDGSVLRHTACRECGTKFRVVAE
jgi:ferredoxin-like protein FixX